MTSRKLTATSVQRSLTGVARSSCNVSTRPSGSRVIAFIRPGRVWTSAGITAGIDLARALIEEDLGSAETKAAAEILLVHHRRWRSIAVLRHLPIEC